MENERNKTKKKLGNCFETAYKAAEKFTEKGWLVYLVHGIVTGAKGSEIEDIEYIHAWVELSFGTPGMRKPSIFVENNSRLIECGNEMCYDSESRTFVHSIQYYDYGRIKDVAKYRFIDARIKALEFGHFGPWVERYLGINEKLLKKF